MDNRRGFRKTHIGDKKLEISTQMMAYGFDPALSEGSVKPPVFLTSTFVFQSAEDGAEIFDIVSGRKPAKDDVGNGGLVYSRFNHPNTEIVEDRLAVADRAEAALLTSSGMAAISSVFLTFLRPGDSLVHYTPLYGGTEGLIANVLTDWNIHPQPYEDGLSEDALRDPLDAAHQKGPVKIIYMETPANPTNAMVDLALTRRVADQWAKEKNCDAPLIVCDNTMLGPVFQQPMLHGTDLCVYSLTKYVGGHSDLVAGAVTGSKALVSQVRVSRGAYGNHLDPHSSWMLSRSMETLDIRMRRAAESGSKIANWLAHNTLIPCEVLHPEHSNDPVYKDLYARQCSGPGSTFSFVIRNDRALAFRVLNHLQIFKLAVSLGGTESLVSHPASTTHSGVAEDMRNRAGVTEGLIRISVGLEHPDDLIADLANAFKQAVTAKESPA